MRSSQPSSLAVGTHINFNNTYQYLPELAHTQATVNTMHPMMNTTQMTNNSVSIVDDIDMGERSWGAFIADKEKLLEEMNTANNFNKDGDVAVPSIVNTMKQPNPRTKRRSLEEVDKNQNQNGSFNESTEASWGNTAGPSSSNSISLIPGPGANPVHGVAVRHAGDRQYTNHPNHVVVPAPPVPVPVPVYHESTGQMVDDSASIDTLNTGTVTVAQPQPHLPSGGQAVSPGMEGALAIIDGMQQQLLPAT